MDQDKTVDRYGVIGNPIHHSQSPLIHRLFSEQAQQLIQYDPILVEIEGLAAALDDFQLRGGKGLNITLPFKQEAFHLVDKASDLVLSAKALNTITFNDDGSRWGDNTDGIGLVRDIVLNCQFPVQDKRVLVLGAGGAVSGVMVSLLNEKPAELVIANRTASKAFALADHFNAATPIVACSLSDIKEEMFDLIINGTSASLQGEPVDLPVGILGENTFCYDMMYGKGLTPFLSWACQLGVKRYSDGWGMLVEQAAESFYLWRKCRPDTQAVLGMLKINKN